MVVKLSCGLKYEKFAFYLDDDILIDLFIKYLLKNDDFIEIKRRYNNLHIYNFDDCNQQILYDNKAILQKYNLDGIIDYIEIDNSYFNVDICKKILPVLISLYECELETKGTFLDDLRDNIDIFTFAIEEEQDIIII